MEITIRYVLEVSPQLAELLGRLLAGVASGGQGVGAGCGDIETGGPATSPVTAAPPPQVPPPSPEAPAAEAGETPADHSAEPGKMVPPEAPEAPARGEWRTAERLAVLERLYPAGVDIMEIRAALAALDGPPLPEHQNRIAHWARDRGLSRPSDGAEPWRTPERAALLKETWEAGVDPYEIAEAMRKLPGGPVEHRRLSIWAAQLHLKRPADYMTRLSRERNARIRAARWGDRAQGAEQDTRAGVASVVVRSATTDAGPPVQGGGAVSAPMEAADGAVPDLVLPQPKATPPAQAGGEAAPSGSRPPAPPEPPVAAQRRRPPPLPSHDEDGLIRASFREIKEWAAFYGIAYNGANVDAVNRRRGLMGLRPVAQCEARTMAERRAA